MLFSLFYAHGCQQLQFKNNVNTFRLDQSVMSSKCNVLASNGIVLSLETISGLNVF